MSLAIPDQENAAMRFRSLFLCLLALPLAAQEPQAPSGRPIDPVVGSFYFYWYRWPDSHFKNADGSDALTQHFARPEGVDFDDPAYHRREIDQMIEAGLDFFLPVYWGIPDVEKPEDFSVRGLKAIVEALQSIKKAGGTPPKVGMFFDTSTLLLANRGEGATGTLDLREARGKRIFGDTVLSFFSQVPREDWMEIDGFPVIVLYSSFGAPHARNLLEEVEDRFIVQFKKRPVFIAEESWQVSCFARYRWGAALHGPTGDPVLKVIGPGYDDRAVPDRGTPIRDRENGRFYEWSWNQALLDAPTVVLIETWNEFHEGTGIAPCSEFGSTYVDLTRRMVNRLKKRLLPSLDEPVRLVHPDPMPRPDEGWFTPGPDTTSVLLQAAALDAKGRGKGLRLAKAEDGPFELRSVAEVPLIESRTTRDGTSYLYFGVADEFAHRDAASYRLEVEVLTGEACGLRLQYDSFDLLSPLKGAYKSGPRADLGASPRPERRTLIWTIPDARFSNRQNGAADFRLCVTGAPARIVAVRLERLGRLLDGESQLEMR